MPYNDQVDMSTIAWYQLALRALLWPAIYAYLNLAYLVWELNRFYNNLGPVHIELLKHVLQYISTTLDLSLKFDGKADTPDDVVGYTYFNFTRLKWN